jgi:predicted nuclease of predicted toxin-antitoxin system
VKIKVDENIGKSGVVLLRQAGHDVSTVREQGIEGAADEALFQVCAEERRALITLDRDFGQVLRFPPGQSAGIAVLELGGPATIALLQNRLRAFIALSTTRSIDGELWIVEPGRIRVHIKRDD